MSMLDVLNDPHYEALLEEDQVGSWNTNILLNAVCFSALALLSGISLYKAYLDGDVSSYVNSFSPLAAIVLWTITLMLKIRCEAADFRMGSWAHALLPIRFVDCWDWRATCLIAGIIWSAIVKYCVPTDSWLSLTHDPAALSAFSVIGSLDLGYSLMRHPRLTVKEIWVIICVGLFNCVITTVLSSVGAYMFLPQSVSEGLSTTDYIAIGAVCSRLEPQLCTKYLGLDGRDTHYLHCLLVGESIISDFITNLCLLSISKFGTGGNKFELIQFVTTLAIYGMSVYAAKWLAYIAFELGKRLPISHESANSIRFYRQWSCDLWCIMIFISSLASYTIPEVNLCVIATCFGMWQVHYMRNRINLRRYNVLSSLGDVATYLTIGVYGFSTLHRWNASYVSLSIVGLGIFCRAPTMWIYTKLKPEATMFEMAMVWMAGFIRGAGAISLAIGAFGAGAAIHNESHSTLVSSTITASIFSNMLIGFGGSLAIRWLKKI